MKSAGYKPNNGLDDRRLALLWIQHHIRGFNGDPRRVTFVGESSGAGMFTWIQWGRCHDIGITA